MQTMEVYVRNTVGLREVLLGKTMNSHKSSRENSKKILKTVLKGQNTHFSRLNQVVSKLPGPVARTLKTKILKNFLSIFCDWKFYPRGSREISMKISKYPHDWNLHPWTSRQSEPQETLKTQILKNILSIFRDWDIDPPVRCKKSLCGLAIGTCD